MKFFAAFLVAASLASGTDAGPTRYQKTCATSECHTPSNYFYEIGRIYEYDYEVITQTSVEGTDNTADTTIKAKVLIQPNSPCDFSLTVKDVSLLNSEKSQEFADAITKESIRFSFDNGKIGTVCASEDEPMWVLNFKKGIISSMQNSMEELEGTEVLTEKDISGVCETSYTSEKEGSTTKITRTKYQSKCKGLEHNTINKLSAFGYSAEGFFNNLPLFDGEQTCEQEISEEIIQKVDCKQIFRLRPFKANTGAITEIWTKLSLFSVTFGSPPNDALRMRTTFLEFEDSDTNQNDFDERTAEDLLYKLQYLTENGISKEVPALFSELVIALKNIDVNEIQRLYNENDKFAKKFLQDALMLVGTPASTEMITNLIVNGILSSDDQDAFISSLSFNKNPELKMFSAIQPLFETKLGEKAILRISTMVHNYCAKDIDCDRKSEIINVIKSFESILGVGCRTTSDEERTKIVVALKALGNAGIFVNAKSTLERCYTEENDMEIRIAAIEAWRRTSEFYSRENILLAFQDRSQDNEIRIAAYLAVMVHPTKKVIDTIKESLISEGVNQVASFVWTHMTNLQESAFPEKQAVRELIGEELLQKKFNPEVLKFSRNFESSFMLDHLNVGGMTEANVIFSSQSFLPRSAMINFNIDSHGESINLFEIGGRIEGFESYIEKFFGKDGYYPEETIEGIIKTMRQQKQEEENMLDSYLTKSSNDPEGSFYMKIFGNELSYNHFHSLKELMPELDLENPMDILIELMRKGNVDYTKSFNILDTEFTYPTIAGLPLNLKMNGAATLRLQVDGIFDFESLTSMNIQGIIHPSAAISIDGSMSVDAFVTESGIKIFSTMFSSSRIEGKGVIDGGKLVDFEINLPKNNDVSFEFTNDIFRIENGQEKELSILPSQHFERCLNFMTLSACYESEFYPVPYHRPYYPLSGPFKTKLHLKATDSDSPIKFQYKNDEDSASIVLNVPSIANNGGFSIAYNKREKELNINVDDPNSDLSYYGKAKYNFDSNKKEISYIIGDAYTELYGAKVLYIDDRQSEKLGLIIEFTKDYGNIVKFDGSYNYGEDSDELKLNIEVASDSTSKNHVRIDYSGVKKYIDVDILIRGTKFLLFRTDITTNGNEKLLRINGNTNIGNRFGSQTFTGRGSYKYETLEDGKEKYSGKLEIDEFDINSDWHVIGDQNSVAAKISGVIMKVPFNIDTSRSSKFNDALIDMVEKGKLNIPLYGIDITYSRSLFFDSKNFKLNSALYSQHISAVNNIDWEFGESFQSHIEYDLPVIHSNVVSSLSSKNVNDATKIAYKLKGNIGRPIDFDGTLNYINVPDRFNADLEFETTANNNLYKTKWNLNADRNEMNLQGSLNTNGELRTIFAKVTPTSLNISNTFYKPLAIEATIVTKGENKEVMIGSSSEDHTFRLEGRISPNSLHGTIKVGKFDVGISGTLNSNDINTEVWWSSEERISFSGNYNQGEGSYLLLATLMTPFEGLEKQDMRFSLNCPDKQIQSSFTWGNDNYLTLSGNQGKADQWTTLTALKMLSSIDCLDNILLSVTHQNSRSNGFEFSVNFIAPFVEDIRISFKIADFSLFFLTAYGATDLLKIEAKGDLIDCGNMNGSILFSCPYLIDIDLEGKLETGNGKFTSEIKGNIDNKEILLSFNNEYLTDIWASMMKSNIDIIIDSVNVISISFDYQLLNKSEFKTDFEITSNYFISPDFAIDGHMEGNLDSLSQATLTGYISGMDIDGHLILNHLIEDSKLSSNMEVTLNKHYLNYKMDGIVDIERSEANFDSKVESSITEIDGWNLSFNHAKRGTGRKTTINLSKGEFDLSLSHEFEFSDLMNWSNQIIVNKNLGMKTVLKGNYSLLKFSADMFKGEDIIHTTLKVDRDDGLIESSLNTPWTKPLKISAKLSIRSEINGHVEVTYGESMISFIGKLHLQGNKNTGSFVVTNERWAFTPFKLDFKYLEEKSLEVKITNPSSRSLLIKISREMEQTVFKIEYQGSQTYMLHLEHEGTISEGSLETHLMIPPMTSTPMITQVSYKYKPSNWSVHLHSIINDKSYKIDYNLNQNDMKLITEGPFYKTITLANWKFQGERGVLSINFEIPNKMSRSLDVFVVGKSFKISYVINNGEAETTFTGDFNNNTLSIAGKTVISGNTYLDLDAIISSKYCKAELIYMHQKYTVTYNINMDSIKTGSADILILTPIPGYRSNKLNLDYSFDGTKKSVTFTTIIDSKNEIDVSIERSSEEILMKLTSPWTEKISLKATFVNHSIKMVGEYKDLIFNWTLKAIYDQKRKINISMNLTSNIEGWTSYSITADVNGSQIPYSAILEIEENSQKRTYSILFKYDKESFSIETITPLEGLEKLRASGQYNIADNFFKTYFTLSNKNAEITFTGSVSSKNSVPEIKVKVHTPFSRFENIEFTLDGSFDEQKSLTVSAIVDQTEYYTNIFFKHENLNGRVGINFRSPFSGFREISFNTIYNLSTSPKIVKLNYNWNMDKLMVDAKMNLNEIDVKLESSIAELKSFRMKGDHSKIANGYIGHGIIEKNGMEYEFQGKAEINNNDFSVEMNLPTDDLFISGSLLSDGIKVTLTKGTGIFAKNYDMMIKYSFTPHSTYFLIYTPFEFLSKIDLKLTADNKMVNAALHITKYSQNYDVQFIVAVAPKKSKLNVNVTLPEYFYKFNALYDFVSEEKYAELTRETTYSRIQYTAKALMKHTEESQGYVKITTSHSNYSLISVEYKIQSAVSLKNIDSFISVSFNDKTTKFGLKSEFRDGALICLVETPLPEFEKVGFKLIKTAHGFESGIYFGKLNIIFDATMSPGEYSVNIEMPFDAFSHAHLSFKHRWETYEKYGVLLAKFNDQKIELIGSLKKSWNSPQIILKFVTPFYTIPKIEIIGSYDLSKHEAKVALVYNDLHFLFTTILDATNTKFYINVDVTTPILGWREIDFLTNIDFSDDNRIFQIYLQREDEKKEIFLNGKMTGDEMNFDFENSFENIPNFRTTGSLDRSKRSLKFVTNVKDHVLDVTKSFNSLKATINTPYLKAKEVSLELIRTKKGFAINYKRNDNYIKYSVSNQTKKKGMSIEIKSRIPGWELLALTGRLDLDEIKAYVSAHKNQKKIEISGSGTFSEKQGSFKLTMKTPFKKYQVVTANYDYNLKRKIITYEIKSNSSNFHILLEFKRGITVDIFVPHPSENTVIKGSLTAFKGNLTGSSRFAFLRTINFKYEAQLQQTVKVTVLYERNKVKIFELEFVANRAKNTLHFEVHGRLFGNHSMFHVHREGFKKFTLIVHRNSKELKIDATGSGDLPTLGNFIFTIDNSFREVPKHISGSIAVDRRSSPKTLLLKLEYPGRKLYTANIKYNGSFDNLRKGDFDISITTPEKRKYIWNKISGEWNINKNKIISASLSVGPLTYKLDGKIGIFDTDIKLLNVKSGKSHFIIWTFKSRSNGRDYYLKTGSNRKYVMMQYSGKYKTIKNGDVSGSFRVSPLMKNDLKFTEKWDVKDGTIKGSGSFTIGNKKGTSQYTASRNSNERAVKFQWKATTNIRLVNNVQFNLNYNLAKRFFNYKLSWDTDSLSFDIKLDNFSLTSSSNTAHFHIPGHGDGELTVTHDFTKPLVKSIKATGKIGKKNISYSVTWTRNAQRTLFNLNAEVKSLIFGSGTLHAKFDLQDLKNATAELHYKRNKDKFVTINWYRKMTNKHIEGKLTFASHFILLPSAKVQYNIDWAKGFHATGTIEWKQHIMNKINVKVDFSPGKLTASITTPFKIASNINFSFVYNMKGKKKTATLHYSRGNRIVHLSFSLVASKKKSGSIDIDLKTPIDTIKHLSFSGKWEGGKFNATYKRNKDIQVDLQGSAEVKLKKSSFHVKFTPPNRSPIDLAFSYNVDKFINGKGKKSEKLIDFNVKVDKHNVKFSIVGFRNNDKVFIEIDGSTSFDKFSNFYLKIDSELNLVERIGHFEVRANDFHFKASNTFEKLDNGFYVRSQIDTSATPLPGLIIGFGRNGESFIGTLGYGKDREITFSIKGNDHFRKGFSGEIDIPRHKINNVQYDITYGFNGPNKVQSSLKIKIDENRSIDAEIVYDSDGVRARMKSLLLGNYNVRARRSISDDHFLVDFGVNDYGLIAEGNLNKDNKGFKLEGEIMGKSVMIDTFFNINGLKKSEGRLNIKTPFTDDISTLFTFSFDNQKLGGLVQMNYADHKLVASADFDLDNKIAGYGVISVNEYSYELKSNLIKLAADNYVGYIVVGTPFNTWSMTGSCILNGFYDLSGNFKLEFNNEIMDIEFSNKLTNQLSILDVSLSTPKGTQFKVSASYPYLFETINFDIKMSKYINSERTFILNTKFALKSLKEMTGAIEIGSSKPILKVVLDSFMTVHNYQGVFAVKLFDNNEFSLRADIPFSYMKDTIEILLVIDSPLVPKMNLSAVYDNSIKKLNVDSSVKIYGGVYKTFFTSSITTSTREEILVDMYAEVKLPNSANKYAISINYLLSDYYTTPIEKALVTIYYGKSVTSLNYNIVSVGQLHIRLESNLLNFNGTESIDFHYRAFESTLELKTELLLHNKKHNLFVRVNYIDLNEALILLESPLLPTGALKIDASCKHTTPMNLSLHISMSDTNDTYSFRVEFVHTEYLKERELSVEVRTPIEKYEKMNFAMKYIAADVSFFSMKASPFNLKAETYFGVTDNVFSAGVDIETGIVTWELTKLQAHIPLTGFSPRLAAKINGLEYKVEVLQNRTQFGGDWSLKVFKGKRWLDVTFDYRLKAPFHLSSTINSSAVLPGRYSFLKDLSITFDSSLLILVPAFMSF